MVNLGNIWKSNIDGSATALFVTIPNAGTEQVGTNEDRGITTDDTQPNHDNSSYPLVGKIGLGGIGLSSDGKYLYAVNLNDKKLYKITVDSDNNLTTSPSSDDIVNYDIPAPSCTNGEWRPFALKYYRDSVYIGGVCDAENGGTKDNLLATIYKFDGTNFTTILSFPLNYDKVALFKESTSVDDQSSQWHPWINGVPTVNVTNINNYPQPVLSDIEFDENGDMLIAFFDRYGHQTGHKNYVYNEESNVHSEITAGGDILKACLNDSNEFILENDGVCGGVQGAGINLHSGPGGKEYYHDKFKKNSEDLGHSETSSGGAALIAGSKELILNSMDPVNWDGSGIDQDYFRAGGPAWYGADGNKKKGYHLFKQRDYNAVGWAKGTGVGDLELLCPPAPTEVGNRVWEDTNSNGIQDADEIGIANVSVELVCGGRVVETATTDENGNYIFSNDPAGTSTSSHKYNVSDLVAGSDNCLVRVPNVVGTSKQTALGITSLTVPNIGEGSNANNNDSDGIAVGDNADANILSTDIPSSGANNHSFDFGFSPKPIVSIGSLIWEDPNNDGLQDDDESGIADVNVTLLDENGTVMPNPVQKTESNGQYYFSGLDEGSYSILVTPPSGMGYVPCTQQTTADNDDTENDSNIKSSNGNEYTSGKFTLQAGTEPTESSGKTGTDSADDSDDENGNMTVDFCFYRPASLGDYVWYDDNRDGIQDANETGVEGVTVELLSDCSRRGSIETTTTDVDGKYKFTNLTAGDYCIEFSGLPSDYIVTTKGAGSATDSDASTTAPFITETITLDVGEEDLTWDMGIYSSKVAIGDRVWYDTNKNGQQDNGESGVPNIEVKLLEDCTTEVNSTTTDASGNYIFEALSAGTYCLEFGTLPDGFVISPQDSGDDATDSDVNATTKRTIPVTLEDGARDLTWDMGIYAPATLGDKVWNDKNANGIQDADELPVQGVDVTLLGSDCATVVDGIDPQTTDENGLYLFEDLLAGDYCVRFTNIPVGYAISPQNQGDDTKDSDVNVSTGITTVVTLNAGDDDRTLDMGIYEEASIGNYVWNDANANGEQEVREEPVEGVTVTLYDADCTTVAKDNKGEDIATVQTDANGLYKFEHLMPSEYCLGFSTLPEGFGATLKDAVADDIDSDVDTTTLKTVSTVLDAGEADMSWDMGIFQSASIGDRVWYDNNANGIQEADETGVENVRVNLYQTDCTTVAVDGKGVEIPATQTDANGNYTFINLVPNDYCVGFDLDSLPEGYKVSPKSSSVATEDKDSDADETTGVTESTNLVGGENDTTWDMGIYSPASLGDKVWLDNNANGIQDANETGVEGVTVTLYEGDCTTAVSVNNDGGAIVPVTTDANGNYNFTNLVPAEYCVGFTLPEGYRLTAKDATDDLLDSDVNSNLKTDTVVLVSGENNITLDMGIYKPASIGNVVWKDSNADGIQDANESKVQGVEVTLYDGTCTNVVTVDNSGEAISVQTTDVNGEYNFTNLTPGSYCVGFDKLPEDYKITKQDSGSNDELDSDVDPITKKAIGTILDSGENDLSWDMGIYKPASIGNRVWNDTNANGIQDAGESGVSDIKVTLYGSDCTTVAVDESGENIEAVVTNASGEYGFNNLVPNDYCVTQTAS